MTKSVLTNTVCLRAKSLRVLSDGQTLLEGIDLEVRRGEVLAVTGPNGAGKTTLLRAILGELPWEGELSRTGSIGYVPQRLAFDPTSCASVLDLFALSLSRRPPWLGISRKIKETARAALSRIGAEELLRRPFGRLSGGERQRVLLALALTPLPDLLLLDEPEAGVDLEGLELFHHVVGSLCPHCRTGVLLITHAPETLSRISHRRLRLEQGRMAP
jgi:zinc transport system ATP-binding protein